MTNQKCYDILFKRCEQWFVTRRICGGIAQLKVKGRPLEIGYDVRCQDPIAYDLTYCTELAMGVYQLYKEGKTGCMVYVDSYGNVSPLYLAAQRVPQVH